jgi:hypothetical protein
MPCVGLGRDAGREKGSMGDEFVGALLTISVMNWATLLGWTLRMRVNAGRRRTVVGSE